MARVPYEKNLRVDVVPDIADPTGPTLAEIGAGDDLSHFVTKDGFDPGSADNQIPTGAIDTDFDAEIQGSFGKKLKIDFMIDDVTNVAWDALPRKTRTFIVVRQGIPNTTAYAAGQKVDVYEVETGSRMRQKSAPNAMQKFQVACAVASFEEDATVAA